MKFKFQFLNEVQVQSPSKPLGISTKVLHASGPNYVITNTHRARRRQRSPKLAAGRNPIFFHRKATRTKILIPFAMLYFDVYCPLLSEEFMYSHQQHLLIFYHPLYLCYMSSHIHAYHNMYSMLFSCLVFPLCRRLYWCYSLLYISFSLNPYSLIQKPRNNYGALAAGLVLAWDAST